MKLCLLFALLACTGAVHADAAAPTALRVERLLQRDALGVDSHAPLLSWSWAGDARLAGPPPAATVSVAVSAAGLDAAPLWSGRSTAPARYGGPALASASVYHWRVCIADGRCAAARFVTGRLERADWSAVWIGGRQLRSPEVALPAGRKVASAVVTVTGLGFYELWLNGARVGDAVLDPGFSTNVTERILYGTYDVSAAVAGAGSILVLAARVGAGKYSYSVNPFAVPGKDVFALLCQLTVQFADGGKPLTLGTDGKWLESDSPIVWEHLYHGEHFDARLERRDWASVGASKSGWREAKEVSLPAGADAALSARLFPPIRIVQVVSPTNATQLSAASFLYDLGNNYAGVARVRLPVGAKGGSILSVTCTEYKDVASVPGGPPDIYGQQDRYTFSGSEAAGDDWAPAFVYHGFRYIRVDFSDPAAAKAFAPEMSVSVSGLWMHSDVARHGRFAASGEHATEEGARLQAIQNMIVQTQRDNLHSVPTDCPQREKRGWMGDAQWTAEEARLNFDMSALYVNWIRTMADLQSTGCTQGIPDSHGHLNMSGYCWSYSKSPKGSMSACNLTNSYCCLPTPPSANPKFPQISFCSPQYNQTDTLGSIPDVVPNSWGRGGSRGWPGAPTWSSALVVIPGVLQQYDADVALMKTFYGAVKAHVDFLARQTGYGHGTVAFGMLGDWCSVEPFCPGSSDGCLANPGWTSGDATSSYYFVVNLRTMVSVAKALNNTADHAKYSAALAVAKAAYAKQYFNSSSNDFGESQTANALGLLAAPTVAPGAVARLVANIKGRGTHVSTGGVGARWILQALSAAKQTELALDLATQVSGPSWFWFTNCSHCPGTLHENWPNSAVPSGTTSGSLNHIMFGGGIGAWLYHRVAGLRPSATTSGLVEFGVDAAVLRRVGAASARTMLAGDHLVESSWSYNAATFELEQNVTVPLGFRGSLVLPRRKGVALSESGAAVEGAEGAEGVGAAVLVDGETVAFATLSGRYFFRAKYVEAL